MGASHTVSQGRITCASLMSSLYAIGVTSVDNLLCLLSLSTRLTEAERDLVRENWPTVLLMLDPQVVPLILEGVREAASEAGTSVSGRSSSPSLF